MAFTWKQKKATLRRVIAAALKLDVADTSVLLADGTYKNAELEGIQWENERAASRPTRGVWCDLRLGVIVPIGQDEVRYDYDAGTDRYLPTYGGPRRFGVMVIIGSDDQENNEAIGDVASLLRTRLMREELLQALIDTDLGLTRIAQTLNVDYEDDGRMYSQSMTEVFFETNEQDEPTSADRGDYIKHVEAHGDYYSTPPEVEDSVDVVVDVTGSVVTP